MKKRKDGRYEVSVTSKDGRRKTIYGKTQTEIKQKVYEFQNSVPPPRTFEQAADRWMENFWRTVGHKTMSQYEPAYNRIVAQFGKKYITDVSSASIQAFINSLKVAGYSASYIKAHRIVLTKIFDYEILSDDSNIKFNPVTPVRVPRIAKKKIPSATPKQEEAVREAVDEPFGLFAYLLLNTGCRSQEALALQWKDFDFANDVIVIDKAVTFPHNQAEIKETKTVNGERNIPLLGPLRTKLAEVVRRNMLDPEQYVFGGEKPLSQTEYKRRWRQYALKLGFIEEYFVDEKGNRLTTLSELQRIQHKKVTITHLTPHQLRHSYATMCLEAGLSPEEAQRFLGHADVRTTINIYADIRATKQQAAAEKLNKFAMNIGVSKSKDRQ